MGFLKSFFTACKKRILKFFRSKKNKKSKAGDGPKNPNTARAQKLKETLSKTLGVSNNATLREIREGYLKKSFEHHPDRHSDATEEVRKWHEEKFKLVGNAYSILSSAKLKWKWREDKNEYQEHQSRKEKLKQNMDNVFGDSTKLESRRISTKTAFGMES